MIARSPCAVTGLNNSAMTPDEFVNKWAANTRSEQAASKEHFVNLCDLLEVPTPNSDATGASYAFEKGAKKAAGTAGWADVWRRGCFGWEYKSRGGDLEKAHDQLLRYCGALENPPLLITSDMDRIVVRTNFQGKVSERFEFAVEDIRDPTVRTKLRACWTDPNRWMPGTTRQALTEKVAGEFAVLARRLRERHHDPQVVAHFVNRLVFCLFADHVELLPNGLLAGLLAFATRMPAAFEHAASELFAAMAERGGRIGFVPVQWFNGGLFDNSLALPLEAVDIKLLVDAASLDWSEIDPSIFGTLFERGLDPGKRSQLGAHYTDPEKISTLVEAVVVGPLLAEWASVKERIRTAMEERALLAKYPGSAVAADVLVMAGADAITAESQAAKKNLRTAAERRRRKMAALLVEAQTAYQGFMDRLRSIRVLDPACGSGNFLYMSLLALKDLELRIDVEAEVLGLNPSLPSIGPECVHGIEINAYAAELARVSVWIGHIQWSKKNGYPPPVDPVLQPLHTIDCRDALIHDDGTEAAWPAADVIIGNPPFLGGVQMRSRMEDDYYTRLRDRFDDRIPGTADLVTYWFEKARNELAEGRCRRVGFVSTNSIRGQGSRAVLQRIIATGTIFKAWSDEEWAVDGADVRVSLVCFATMDDTAATGLPVLDDNEVAAIGPDLRGDGLDLTVAEKLAANANVVFQGSKKVGPFEVSGEVARNWLREPANANRRPNSDVLRPSWIAIDVVRRPRDKWIVDFFGMTEAQAAFFSSPFGYVETTVKPLRDRNTRPSRRDRWWLHGDAQPSMRRAVQGLERYIVTPEVSKHRIFRWAPAKVLSDCKLMVISKDDDVTFGILHSRFHEVWSLRTGEHHGVGNDPRYTPSTTFETFPFPEGLTPDLAPASYAADPRAVNIATAARSLVEARDQWLTPAELVVRSPEVVAGFPDRILPADPAAATALKDRTLTNLYNMRGTPQGAWLDNLHRALDAAVAEAYGWPHTITDEVAMQTLLALNAARPKAG